MFQGSNAAAGKSLRLNVTMISHLPRMAAGQRLALLLRQRDSVGLIRFDSEVRSVIPSRARSIHWHRIVGALGEAGSGLASDAPGGLLAAASLEVAGVGAHLRATDAILARVGANLEFIGARLTAED